MPLATPNVVSAAGPLTGSDRGARGAGGGRPDRARPSARYPEPRPEMVSPRARKTVRRLRSGSFYVTVRKDSGTVRNPALSSRNDPQGRRHRLEPDAFVLTHILAVNLEGHRPGRGEGHFGLVVQGQHATFAGRAGGGQHVAERAERADRPHAAQGKQVEAGIEPGL